MSCPARCRLGGHHKNQYPPGAGHNRIGKKRRTDGPPFLSKYMAKKSEQSLDVFPVELGDKFHVDPLRAGGLALVMVGAVAETQPFGGFRYQVDATLGFYFALGEDRQLGNFGAGE